MRNNNVAMTLRNEVAKSLVVVNKDAVPGMVKLLKDYNPNIEIGVYDTTCENVPFDCLTEEIQDEVKSNLMAFDECHVEHCHGKFSVHTGWVLSASYAEDECVIGTYKASEVFTEEERIINYAESFHEFSPLYHGARDYRMMKMVENDWSVKFKMVDGNLQIA